MKKYVLGLFLIFFITLSLGVVVDVILSKILPVTNYNIPKGYHQVEDESLMYDIRPSIVTPLIHNVRGGFSFPIWSNSLGCFDKEYSDKNSYSILLVGDSFTWGFVPYKKSFGSHLERILQKNILKCGVSGFETKDELGKAKKTIKTINKTPSIIIVGYYLGNDILDRHAYPYIANIDGLDYIQKTIGKNGEVFSKTKKEINNISKSFRIRLHVYLKKNSYIYDKLLKIQPIREAITPLELRHQGKNTNEDLLYYNDSLEWVRESFNVHSGDILNFKAYADSIGSKLLFVLIPERYSVYPIYFSSDIRNKMDGLRNKLNDFFQKQGIDFLDLTSAFRSLAEKEDYVLSNNKGLYYEYDGHWNSRGHQLAAEEISEYLEPTKK